MKWTIKNIPSLKGKKVIVTGANSGIGFETAKALMLKVHMFIQAAGMNYLEFLKEVVFQAKLHFLIIWLSVQELDQITDKISLWYY